MGRLLPEDAEIELDLAMVFYQEGRLETAISSYCKAVTILFNGKGTIGEIARIASEETGGERIVRLFKRLWQYAHVVFDLTHAVEPAAAPLK